MLEGAPLRAAGVSRARADAAVQAERSSRIVLKAHCDQTPEDVCASPGDDRACRTLDESVPLKTPHRAQRTRTGTARTGVAPPSARPTPGRSPLASLPAPLSAPCTTDQERYR